jgi:hypothetical protein
MECTHTVEQNACEEEGRKNFCCTNKQTTSRGERKKTQRKRDRDTERHRETERQRERERTLLVDRFV